VEGLATGGGRGKRDAALGGGVRLGREGVEGLDIE